MKSEPWPWVVLVYVVATTIAIAGIFDEERPTVVRIAIFFALVLMICAGISHAYLRARKRRGGPGPDER